MQPSIAAIGGIAETAVQAHDQRFVPILLKKSLAWLG